jgi:hypothetical protein
MAVEGDLRKKKIPPEGRLEFWPTLTLPTSELMAVNPSALCGSLLDGFLASELILHRLKFHLPHPGSCFGC